MGISSMTSRALTFLARLSQCSDAATLLGMEITSVMASRKCTTHSSAAPLIRTMKMTKHRGAQKLGFHRSKVRACHCEGLSQGCPFLYSSIVDLFPACCWLSPWRYVSKQQLQLLVCVLGILVDDL